MMRRLLLLAFALALAGFLRLPHPSDAALTLSVLNVGQGDAILIRTPSGADVLVDAGPGRRAVDALGAILPAGDRDLELVVLTHPHADHIAGLPYILDHYTVRQVWTSGVRYDAPVARAVDRRLTELRVPVRPVQSGTSASLGDVRVEVLAPLHPADGRVVERDDARRGGGLNDDSVVLRLTYRSFCALLMGDASEAVEAELTRGGSVTRCAVLKVGHHGSRFSSSDPFLDAVSPQLAVIAVGPNRYGHPAPAALRRLASHGILVFRTDQSGAIRVETDGYRIRVRLEGAPP
jgi:competence protein ComEC